MPDSEQADKEASESVEEPLAGRSAERPLATRIADLERENQALATQLLEQEHRTFHIWKNWYQLRSNPPDNVPVAEHARWRGKRRASSWALLWHIVGPQGVVAAGLPIMAIAGVVLAWCPLCQ